VSQKSACWFVHEVGFQNETQLGQETKDGKILGLSSSAVTAKAFDSNENLNDCSISLRSFGRGVLEEPARSLRREVFLMPLGCFHDAERWGVKKPLQGKDWICSTPIPAWESSQA